MNLFRKKTTLPEGPARMSVSPSASKKEIGNPAASIGLVIPEAPNYDEERGRQLARSDSYATFFKTGVGLFYHETACTAEKHLAEIEEALTRYTETMESTYRAAVRSQIIQAEQRLERITPKRAARQARQARQASQPRASRNPRDEGVGHEQSHEHRTAWYVGAGQRRPRLFSRMRLPRR